MAKIVLHGDCLIDRAAQLHELFLRHLAQTDQQLEVDLRDVGRCDLSFFQLICAASRSFAAKNKALTLFNPLSQTVAVQYKKTGMGPACLACPREACSLKKEAAVRSGIEM